LFFRYSFPIYRVAKSVDGINFAGTTMWEGQIDAKRSFDYGVGSGGRQFIVEATDLSEIGDNTYDFVLSCHSLEHVANPLRALYEWKRVVKPGGYVLLVLPNKEANFDHLRPTTPFAHLVDDLNNGVDERDLTHLPEILKLHDLGRDKAAGDPVTFEKRSRDNHRNRGLHHHVFDIPLLRQVLAAVEIEEVFTHESYYDHLVIARLEH